MAQGLKLSRRQGVSTPFPSYVNHRSITTAEAETVPAGMSMVIISSTSDIWLSDGTAAVPTGDVVDGTGSFPLKAGVARGFDVTPAQTISVIPASGTALVAFEYFA